MLSQQLPTVNFQKADESAHEKLHRIVQECIPKDDKEDEGDNDLTDDARNTSFQVYVRQFYSDS